MIMQTGAGEQVGRDWIIRIGRDSSGRLGPLVDRTRVWPHSAESKVFREKFRAAGINKHFDQTGSQEARVVDKGKACGNYPTRNWYEVTLVTFNYSRREERSVGSTELNRDTFRIP